MEKSTIISTPIHVIKMKYHTYMLLILSIYGKLLKVQALLHAVLNTALKSKLVKFGNQYIWLPSETHHITTNYYFDSSIRKLSVL
jgi:hypothetical protein